MVGEKGGTEDTAVRRKRFCLVFRESPFEEMTFKWRTEWRESQPLVQAVGTAGAKV